MKNVQTKNVIGAFLFASAFAAGSVMAAENAAGVKEFMVKTIETTKAAQAAAASGDKDGCLSNIKQTKQNYKEITGDAAGKPLQDAMKKIKEAQSHCEAGTTADAAPLLSEAAASMEKVNAGIK